jgi:hypothetical protein
VCATMMIDAWAGRRTPKPKAAAPRLDSNKHGLPRLS